MIKRIKRKIYRKVIRKIQYRLGWRFCMQCRTFTKIKFVKDWVIHEEEPPMFYHYQCSSCGFSSETLPSLLMDSAAKHHGYKNFNDFAKKNKLL